MGDWVKLTAINPNDTTQEVFVNLDLAMNIVDRSPTGAELYLGRVRLDVAETPREIMAAPPARPHGIVPA